MPDWQPIATAPRSLTPILGKNGDGEHLTMWSKTAHVPIYGWCRSLTGDAEDWDLWSPLFWKPAPAIAREEAEGGA